MALLMARRMGPPLEMLKALPKLPRQQCPKAGFCLERSIQIDPLLYCRIARRESQDIAYCRSQCQPDRQARNRSTSNRWLEELRMHTDPGRKSDRRRLIDIG